MPGRPHEGINRRERVAGLFPNETSRLRLVRAILMESERSEGHICDT